MQSSTVRESSSETGLGLDSYLKMKLFIKFNMYFIRYSLPKTVIINRLFLKFTVGSFCTTLRLSAVKFIQIVFVNPNTGFQC